MNKRIESLIAEAFFDESLDVPSDKTYVMNDLMMERFAELIVRKCAGIYEAIDHGNKIEGTDFYPDAIHKYFGVES